MNPGAGDEAGLHSVSDGSSGRIEDLELRQHLDRLVGETDARMDIAMRSRSVNKTSTSGEFWDGERTGGSPSG